jgi:hypothetical protein
MKPFLEAIPDDVERTMKESNSNPIACRIVFTYRGASGEGTDTDYMRQIKIMVIDLIPGLLNRQPSALRVEIDSDYNSTIPGPTS